MGRLSAFNAFGLFKVIRPVFLRTSNRVSSDAYLKNIVKQGLKNVFYSLYVDQILLKYTYIYLYIPSKGFLKTFV